MDRPSYDVPLVPLELSVSAEDSVSTQHEYSSHGTSSANSISDAAESPIGALLSSSPTKKDRAALETTPASPTYIFQTLDRWARHRLPEGWRFGATIGAILSLFALIGNIIVLITVSALVDSKNGWVLTFIAIREGHCSDIENIQLGIHLVINIVSTMLLGASNYCMQCLSAPTRAEVDREHQYGRFLDIGVPSLRNLRVIKKERLICWCLLGLSSLPLHLIYNSTFFVSMANNSYDIYFASHDFQNGEWFDDKLFTKPFPRNPSTIQKQIQGLGPQKNGSVFERLENADCIGAYAKTPLPDRRTVVLVSSTSPLDNYWLRDWESFLTQDSHGNWGNCSTSNGLPIRDRRENLSSCLKNSSIFSSTSYRGRLLPDDPTSSDNWFPWICSQDNEIMRSNSTLCNEGYWPTVKANASEWTVYGFKIDYCISERLEQECKLNMAGGLLTVVIFFNAIKAITIIVVVRRTHDEQLITIGDATASFIQDPDPVTKGLCLYSREDFYDEYFYFWHLGTHRRSSARSFKSEAKRRALAASRRRWRTIIFLVLAGLSIILGLLGYGISHLKSKTSKNGYEGVRSLWELGLGTVNRYTLITGWGVPKSGDGAVILAVLVANTPQALFSMFYLIINGLFTSLSLAAEFSRYANRSTSLRVSNTRGNQRSTYFLQVPYRLAIPLMTASAFLHWIMSQAIFFSQIDARDPAGAPSNNAKLDGPTTCSYSLLAIIITAISVSALMVFAVGLGRRRLPSGMPVAGSCSAAISAVCHCPEGTSELLPVKWGAIPGALDYTADGKQVGHCAFSNGFVENPVEGHMYA